jgi:hypothetical protein
MPIDETVGRLRPTGQARDDRGSRAPVRRVGVQRSAWRELQLIPERLRTILRDRATRSSDPDRLAWARAAFG